MKQELVIKSHQLQNTPGLPIYSSYAILFLLFQSIIFVLSAYFLLKELDMKSGFKNTLNCYCQGLETADTLLILSKTPLLWHQTRVNVTLYNK